MIASDLSLQDALHRGYANLSAVARILKPTIEEVLGRDVKLESIITSLKRARREYRETPNEIQKVVAKSVLNVRTDVAKLAIEKTRRALETVRRSLVEYQEDFLHISEGVSSVTLILDERSLDKVKALFRKDELLEEEKGLAAIIVHSPEEIIKTPGCAIAFYNQVSRRRINIEDTTSCHTDTIIVVKMQDVGRTFTALTELIFNARRSLERRAEAEKGRGWTWKTS